MNTMNFSQPAYPLDAFHLLSENAAREVRWHLKAPDALIGMSILTVMAVACQACGDVVLPIFDATADTPDDGDGNESEDEDESEKFHRLPLTINVMSLAESGERKTAVDRIVGAPIYAHDEKRAMQYESDLATHETDLSIWQGAERGLRRRLAKCAERGEPTDEAVSALKAHAAQKPAEVRLRRTVRSDITKTAIGEALHGTGESIALMSNEGDILLNGAAMRHLSWLNSAWDGSSLSLDRANRKSLLARHPRVTTSILVQPSVFYDYLGSSGKRARGIGYFARYLIGLPRSTQGQRFISGREGSRKHLPLFHARVKELLTEYDRRVASGRPFRDVIHFTAEAKARWIELVNDTEELIQPLGALHEVKDFAAKACENTARVAGILHYFSGQVGGITVDTLERAIALVRWHMDEYERLFVAENQVPQALEDAERLRKYFYRKQQERLQNNKDPRNVQEDPYSIDRKEARHCGPVRKNRFVAAMDVLTARDIVRINHPNSVPSATGQKPSGPVFIVYSDRLGYPLTC
jgi:hypothetical protein